MRSRIAHGAGLALVALLAASSATAVTLPNQFVLENVTPGTGFQNPTAFASTPDGRILVAEKRGVVRVVVGDVKVPHPMWSGETEVLDSSDRGLIGIAVDPHYANNRYVYLLYSVDPDSDGVDDDDDTFGRLTRFQTTANDPNRIDPATRTVLIGRSWRDGIPSASPSHAVDALRWGTDGSLLLSCGDGAQYSMMDAGGRDPNLFAPGRVDPDEDIGSFRAQDVGSLGGKILRLNPATGGGYTTNPFATRDLMANASRVWAYGLRNPFRFCVRPGTGKVDTSQADPGVLAVGDVGWNTREELDLVTAPGQNFGWPCTEGGVAVNPYQDAAPAHHGCSSIGTAENPGPIRPPVATFHHTDPTRSDPPGHRGGCIVGGVFYPGTRYPIGLRGRFFFADWNEDWIKVAKFDVNNQLVEVVDFSTEADGPVDFGADSETGDVMYLSFFTGELRRIRYTGTAGVAASDPRLSLSSSFPNPSTGAVNLDLELPRESRVAFRVLDLQGRRVWNEPEQIRGAGYWNLRWAGETVGGRRAAPGVYLASVEVGGRAYVRRLALLR